MITNAFESAYSMGLRGTLGYSCGFGMVRFGNYRFGFFSDKAGIYKKIPTLQGKKLFRLPFYRPSNPQTTAQQAWRAKVTAGWAQYALLTADEKKALIYPARKLKMTGANLFMSRWLQSQR